MSQYREFRAFSEAQDVTQKKSRPGWDEYFMMQAMAIATRSLCLRRSVGAVIVKNQHVMSTGYNGPPAGFDNPTDVGCFRELTGIPSAERTEMCRGLHAEQNAIIIAAKHGVAIQGGTIYCTHKPCITCQKMIVNSDIHLIKFYFDYTDTDLILSEGLSKGLIQLEHVTSPLLDDFSIMLNQRFGPKLKPVTAHTK